MQPFRFRAWTGPCQVAQIVDFCQQAGLDATAGTEHVYVTSHDGSAVDAAMWNATVDLRRKHGSDFGLTFEPWGIR